jgi:hypothetical protein
LREFTSKVRAKGGGDYEEAIEIGFWHALREHNKNPITSIILIADAPAKSLQVIKSHR